MKMKQKTYTVKIMRTHDQPEYSGVVKHQLLDLHGGCYHMLEWPGDVILYVNDFGVSSVLITPDGAKDE